MVIRGVSVDREMDSSSDGWDWTGNIHASNKYI